MALAALVPLLGSLAGGTAASAGLLGAGMSGVTGSLLAGAGGSALGTLAVTGDPMKALESGALGFLTGGALGGFGGGLGSAAVEAEKAALQAAASGASSGIAGAGADALGAGAGNALANSTQALKAAGIGGAEGALAQNAAQQAALQGADALGSISANLPASISNAGMSGISANLPASIASVGVHGAPALATNAGMGLGQGFKDTLGGIGGMKGLMKSGEIALPGISMSQPELAPYVAPVYTSPGLTPYQQREAGGYTPGYRPGYDPEQLYFKPSATFANGGEVPGYADGNIVRLADGTRNEPSPQVNNLGQQPNQLGRRSDQDRMYGFGGQGEQRSLDKNMDFDRNRFGQNMQPQNQYASMQGSQGMSQGQPMGPGGKGGPTGAPISQSLSVNPSMQSGQPAGPGGKGNGAPMPQNGPNMQTNQQEGPGGKGQGGVPGYAAGIGMNAILHNQNGPGGKGGAQGMQQGMQNMQPGQLGQMMQRFNDLRTRDVGRPDGQRMNGGQSVNSGPNGFQQMNNQQDMAAQQAFGQLQARNLMNQMQNGGPSQFNASMPQDFNQVSQLSGAVSPGQSGQGQLQSAIQGYAEQPVQSQPFPEGQRAGAGLPVSNQPMVNKAAEPQALQQPTNTQSSLPQFGTTPQAGLADGGPVPIATATTTMPYMGGRQGMAANPSYKNPLASSVSARPGLNIPGVTQNNNPFIGSGGGNNIFFGRGNYTNPFFAGGGGMKGNGMAAPFGGGPAGNRPGLHMAFADGGGIPGMSAMGMMGGMPGGDMIVPPVAGDGSSDSIPATIDGKAPALLSADEHVIPADVVAHLGNGSSAVGHKKLRNMVKKVRVKKTGKQSLPKRINPERMMPA